MPSIVVMGASLGGTSAVGEILGGLPKDFPSPVVVVLHRAPGVEEDLPRLLQVGSALPVCEPDDKEPLAAGRIYLAPADYHLLVEAGSLTVSREPPVNHARPSIDVLFDSAADAYGSGVVGVILTGTNADGARGASRIRERGGVVVVQDPTGAEAAEMPAAAIAAVGLDRIVLRPLGQIAPDLARIFSERGEESRRG